MLKNTILIISGFSGSGKGTVIKHLLSLKNYNFALSKSYTTRKQRTKEEEKNYFFLSRSEFIKKTKSDFFLEYCNFFDNYYGTSKDQINHLLQNKKTPILEIDVLGKVKIEKQFQKLFPNYQLKTIFIDCSWNILRERIKERNKNNTIKLSSIKRFDRYFKENRYKKNYSFIVSNNNSVEETVKKILDFLNS